jgi:prophage antirepressor-like protein
MDTNKTERQNYQLTPFTFEDHAVRTVMIDDALWFIAKDVCEVLGIQKTGATFNDFPESEKGCYTITTPGGKQEMLTVNEPGLYRLIFQSRKPEAEKFKTWVFTDVLPQIRHTGKYAPDRPGTIAAGVYSLFSACLDMTIQRVNKLVYYLAVRPPLSNTDIAKLLEVGDSTVTYWRKRLSPDMARKAVEALGINALGHTAQNNKSADFPLVLPAMEADDEAE